MQSDKLHPNPNVITLCLLSQYMFCATANHNLFINAANGAQGQNLPYNSMVLNIATNSMTAHTASAHSSLLAVTVSLRTERCICLTQHFK